MKTQVVPALLVIVLGCSLIGLACQGSPQRGAPAAAANPPGTNPAAANPTGTSPAGAPSGSNGQRIYNTATSSSGQPIVSQGFSMVHCQVACINCHGQDGKGGNIQMMMQPITVPNITGPVLYSGQAGRPAYNADGLKSAISRGLTFGGQWTLAMPRWQMSDRDVNDLVDYLGSLK